ncbi:hypothetical protein [Pyxidicoccus trucidator]|uniref:hypothetical protein n=1 Tax=Pyxidicoccus trucidator TaxID=2709662 RepID=UPI0013DA3D6B|nr:hypothetical protein [Pyxidicoccus trucidator]
MKLKTLMMSLAFGAFLSACGGPLPEEGADSSVEVEVLGDTEQGVCEGWDAGGRRCTWKCSSNGIWIYATSPVAYGGCNAYANNFCKGNAVSVCWSR